MALEAVGTAAAIIQLAQVGLSLAQTLYNLSDDISSAKDQVQDLASYVESTSVILEEVGKVFEEEGAAAHPVISKNAISTANDVVAKCQAFFDTLNNAAEDAKENALGPLKLILKGPRLQKLQIGLEKSKSDLKLMMLIIIEARVRVGTRALNSRRSDIEEILRAITENRGITRRNRRLEHVELEETQEEEQPNEDENIAECEATPELDSPESSVQYTGIGYPRAQRVDVTIAATALLQQTQQADPPNTELPTNRSLKKDQTPQKKPKESIPPFDLDEPSGSDENQKDMSYWSALYLVCCPCLALKDLKIQQQKAIRKSSRGRFTGREAAAPAPRADDRVLMQYLAPDRPYIDTGPHNPRDGRFNGPSCASSQGSPPAEMDNNRLVSPEIENEYVARGRSAVDKVTSKNMMDQLLHTWTTIYND